MSSAAFRWIGPDPPPATMAVEAATAQSAVEALRFLWDRQARRAAVARKTLECNFWQAVIVGNFNHGRLSMGPRGRILELSRRRRGNLAVLVKGSPRSLKNFFDRIDEIRYRE